MLHWRLEPMKTIRLKRKITPPPPPQKTIILQCLAQAYPNAMTLSELMDACEERGYRGRFKTETDLRESICWHLDRMEEVECSN
jgi:hypothetical protein